MNPTASDHEHVYRCQDCDEIGRAPALSSLDTEIERWEEDAYRNFDEGEMGVFINRLVERVKQLRGHIEDIDAHATPFGDIPDEPGWIGSYLLSAGALHRALGTIGHSSPRLPE